MEGKIAKMVGEYFFHARQGDKLLKADWIPEDLPEEVKIELEATYCFIDLLVKLKKIERGESIGDD